MRPPFDRVYCVSLPRSTDRRAHAARELAAVGLGEFQFFDATDHDSPVVTEFREKGLVTNFPPCFRCGQRDCDCANNVLLDPQIATFITYKRLWETIVKDDIGVALIVEDDVKFTPYAPLLLRDALTPANLAACGLARDTEALLRLAWARTEEHAWTGDFAFARGVLKMSNPAFAITNAAARRLLDSFTTINTTVDIYIHERVGLKITNFTLQPPLAYELSWSVGSFPSLIRLKAIHVEYLRRERPADIRAIEAAERDKAAQIIRILPYDVLCVGHPRCGSAYMAHLLTAFGLDVGHERLGAQGISSWMFAVDDDPYPYARNPGAERRRDKHFAVVIQHVRNPADAIPSIMVENRHSPVSYQFRRGHLRKELGIDLDASPSEVERAAVSYLAWNRLIARMKPQLVVPVEHAEEQTRTLLQQRGLLAPGFTAGPLPPKDSNTKKPYKGVVVEKPRLTRAAWTELSDTTREELREFCRIHGYPDPTTANSPAP